MVTCIFLEIVLPVKENIFSKTNDVDIRASKCKLLTNICKCNSQGAFPSLQFLSKTLPRLHEP